MNSDDELGVFLLVLLFVLLFVFVLSVFGDDEPQGHDTKECPYCETDQTPLCWSRRTAPSLTAMSSVPWCYCNRPGPAKSASSPIRCGSEPVRRRSAPLGFHPHGRPIILLP